MGYRGYNIDALTQFKDAGAVTSSAAATVNSAASVIDVGPARVDATSVINVTAVDIADGNETYTLTVQGSNVADMSSGVETLAATAVTPSLATTNGRIELPFTNYKYGTAYRYLRMFTTVAGTTPSINYSAYMSVLQD
jgi:hypothetical protein